MSDWDEEQSEAEFESWNENTQGGTKEDKALLNRLDQGYVGVTKPKVNVIAIAKDPWEYERWIASRKLGLPLDEVPDPDMMSDHSDDQGFDND